MSARLGILCCSFGFIVRRDVLLVFTAKRGCSKLLFDLLPFSDEVGVFQIIRRLPGTWVD
jgi:hypothetical protein